MAVDNGGIEARLFDYLAGSIKETPYYKLLGIELTYLGPGESHMEVKTAEKHSNPLEVIHGALMITLADAVMGNAIRSLGISGVTVDISASLLAAAPFGECLLGKGRVVKAGRQVIFTEGEVWAGERLICQSKGTFIRVGEISL